MPMVLYDASINNVSIHTIAEEIILRDIVENPADMDIQTAKRAMHAGTRETGRTRRKLEIDLVFVIYTQDSRRRNEVCGLIAEWANAGGWLTVNTRPGQRLHVRPTKLPAQGSALRWQEDITLTLTAFEQPYWEDETPRTITFTTSGSAVDGMFTGTDFITQPGNVGFVPLSFFVTNINFDEAPLTHLRIAASSLNTGVTTAFELKGMNQGAGSYMGAFIFIDYDDNDILRIRDTRSDVDDGSLMKYRTAESNDDVLGACGKSSRIDVYADVPVSVTVYARGRWL